LIGKVIPYKIRGHSSLRELFWSINSKHAMLSDMLTRKGQATRDRIVAVAARLMYENGARGTTMEDVCEAAEVSFSQLYHYFTDKMALVRAVISQQTDVVLAAQLPLLAALDSMAALYAWRDVLVDMQRRAHSRGGCPLGKLSTELSELSTDARGDLETAFARWEEKIRSGLRSMSSRGELRAGADPDRLALALLTAVQGGLILTQVRRETSPLEVALDTVLAHIQTQIA
jgi:AcrR family transcriptional regulator